MPFDRYLANEALRLKVFSLNVRSMLYSTLALAVWHVYVGHLLPYRTMSDGVLLRLYDVGAKSRFAEEDKELTPVPQPVSLNAAGDNARTSTVDDKCKMV